MAQVLAKTRSRLPAEHRREQLLDTAAQLLLEHGFDALTMEAVKERAGVSRGLVYVHFANVEDLVFALYEREVTELDRRIIATAAAAGSFEERVRAAIKTYLDFAGERGGVLALLQVKLMDRFSKPSVKEQLGRRFRVWSDELERQFKLSPNTAGALARAAVAGAEQIVAAWRAKQLSRRDAEAMAVAFVLGGLRGVLAGTKER